MAIIDEQKHKAYVLSVEADMARAQGDLEQARSLMSQAAALDATYSIRAEWMGMAAGWGSWERPRSAADPRCTSTGERSAIAPAPWPTPPRARLKPYAGVVATSYRPTSCRGLVNQRPRRAAI